MRINLRVDGFIMELYFFIEKRVDGFIMKLINLLIRELDNCSLGDDF